MLHTALRTLSDHLSDYLKLSLSLKDEIVSIGPLDHTAVTTPPNKVLVTFVHAERETAAGTAFGYRSVSNDRFKKTAPVWQLNAYVVFAAVFTAKQYEDGLKAFSSVLRFLQSNYAFSIRPSGAPFTIEPVNLTFDQLSHIWGMQGGAYFPSLLCKIRMVHIDGGEIKGAVTPVTHHQS